MATRKLRTKATGHFSRCAFCAKPQRAVEVLIAGPGVLICNECVDLCADMLKRTPRSRRSKMKPYDPTPYLEALETNELRDGLANIERVRQDVDSQEQMVVEVLRKRKVSWAEIGNTLGITRQAAWQRFGAADAQG